MAFHVLALVATLSDPSRSLRSTSHAVLCALLVSACSGSEAGGKSGSGGSPTTVPIAGSSSAWATGGATASGSGGQVTSSGGVPSGGVPSGGVPSGGGVPSSTLGGGGQSAAGGFLSGGTGPSSPSSGGVAALGGAVGGGGGTAASAMKDHCKYGYDPLPSDDTMKFGPSLYYPAGKEGDMTVVDTSLQPEVMQWMTDNRWQGAHVEWHAIRGCKSGVGASASHVNICQFTDMIPADQNCQTAGDGYQFLLFHRHMLQALKQLWPKHAADFDGFPTFPQTAEEVPEAWRPTWKGWANDTNGQQILAAAKLGDEIASADNLKKFNSEGEVGYWLQCNVGARGLTTTMPWVGLHFVLHDKWSRTQNRAHGLNNTEVNVENYMFWKLHGWIDNVWEKYRVATGITADPAKMDKYKADLSAQCDEMDKEIRIIKDNLKPGDSVDPDPVPTNETGFFHEQVRPIFENDTNRCVGCHAETGGQLGVPMILGGKISSKKIVEGLLKDSAHAPGFKLVVPGQPEKSWLYLKVSGGAATAGCVVKNPQNMDECNSATMPPTGKVSAADLEIIRKWIADGAAPPP
jgi:hypothetical protein